MEPGFIVTFDGICSIQLSKNNLIRVNGVPSLPNRLIDCVRVAINSGWVKGLCNESVEFGAHEFNLNGSPWYGKKSDGVAARRLLAAILFQLAREGWQILQSLDPTRKQNDKDTMFFEIAKPDPHAEIFVMSFNRLINPPNSKVVDTFKATVSKEWPPGICGQRIYYGADELELFGNPWATRKKEESIAAKQLVAHLIYAMKRIGYKLYAAVDITGRIQPGNSNSRKNGSLDVLAFRKVSQIWGN
ncbi:uncharacterized protein LOC118436660 isoform X2 [Folsomia candida]|uniref:uncharacterized protein LOC118436660 isoform X2 n=1 Tax=Folsomia candida TaxID=158441 RepID=UPI001604C887|nr:uncharacterized protein LOC118436660 isoform X2 [Folsomia candida]